MPDLQTRVGALAAEKTTRVVAYDIVSDAPQVQPIGTLPEVPQDAMKISSKSSPMLSLHDVFDDNKGKETH